jgi:hypothetical protein
MPKGRSHNGNAQRQSVRGDLHTNSKSQSGVSPQKSKYWTVLDRFRIIGVTRYRETFSIAGTLLSECGKLLSDGTTQWYTVMQAETEFQLKQSSYASICSADPLSAPSAKPVRLCDYSDESESVTPTPLPHKVLPKKENVVKPPLSKTERRNLKKVKVTPQKKPDLSKRCPIRLGCTLTELADLSKYSSQQHDAGLAILSMSQSCWCRVCSSEQKKVLIQSPFNWSSFVLSTMDNSGRVGEEEESYTKE